MITDKTKLKSDLYFLKQTSPSDSIITGKMRQYYVFGPVTIFEWIDTTTPTGQTREARRYGWLHDGIQYPASVYGKSPKEMFPSKRAAQREANKRNRLRRLTSNLGEDEAS